MTNESKTDSSGYYRYYVLTILFSVYVITFVDRQIVSILLESIKLEFALSDTQLGLLAGFAFALFHSIMAFFIARLADKGSRKKILAISIGLWSIMTAMCGLAVNFFTLLIARMGVGIFEAGSAPPSHSLISDYFPPEERASALGIFTSGINVGVIISLVVGGWVNQYFGWRAAFFVVGIPGVIMALVVWFSVREPGRGVFDRAKPPMNTNTFQVIRHLLSIPSFRHACLADGFYSIVMYVLLIWGPVYLIRIHGYETGVLGTWLALIIGIGGFIGTLIGGFTADALVKKTGDKAMVLKLCTASTIIATPFFVMFGLSSSPVMALMLLGIGWLVGNLWLGPVYSVIQSLSDASSRAVAVAIALFAVNMIGYGLGPLMVGIVSDALNPAYGDEAIRYALLLVIILAGFAGTIHFFLASRSYVQDLEKKYEEELI